ncbi:hypothetical protein LAZ67_16002509 [Cordylochernes scorpioides]|uniref:Uncharacterized protein n=1 Tax=Cordylochernes scorpioides TaxID=51811 RepID=A0ABY6LC13_9ARAC|nr:hypothetical protein LAZ67_16002509 [Cordylochernes scorpioides]
MTAEISYMERKEAVAAVHMLSQPAIDLPLHPSRPRHSCWRHLYRLNPTQTPFCFGAFPQLTLNLLQQNPTCVLREAWKKCNRNIPDAAKSLQGRLHFKITVGEAFKEGREEVADEPRLGRPTTARTDENVDRVLEVLRTDRRLSSQQIADTLHMSTFVVHGIVTENLQMRKVCAKLVPKVLTQDQKELRVLRCQ